ncbi:disintegrin and metalloproteinase domain-containing protein 5-like [Rhynchocyon petersi]
MGSYLSSNFAISSYDEKDNLHSTPLLAQMDCNYQGYVAGFPNSLVILNTCSRLRGILQFKNFSYGIEPMEAISGFVHMIYEEKNDNINIPPLGVNDTFAWFDSSQKEVRKSSRRTEFFKLLPQYLEMNIIVDKNLFDYMGSDIQVVTQKMILVFGLINAMLNQLKLTVVISSIEIWSEKNKISTSGYPENILRRLIHWEHNSNSVLPHRITYLFAFRKNTNTIGTTFPGKLCALNFGKGVALYPEGLSLESFTVIIVQLLGLNLGLTYDDSDSCFCSTDVCTMTPKAVHFRGIKDFSTCNLDDFKYMASQSEFPCLENQPFAMPAYRSKAVVKTCTHKKCCDSKTCKLKTGMKCGSGECCSQDCKIKEAGVICRKAANEDCDFVEYCNGTSGVCVPDTYVRNGQSCGSGDAFCYEGKCRSFDSQCKNLFGGASIGAPFHCFEEVNSRKDRYGNCGYSFCPFPDLLCGKLVCLWPHKRLTYRKDLSVIYTHVRDNVCVSSHHATERPPVAGDPSPTSYYSADDRDETFVEDGTPCGPDMVCNNFNHCHCDKNFAPPHCVEMAGEFGSIDDGHPIAHS